MSIKLLADKVGALQGMDADSIARQAFGRNAEFLPDPEGKVWPGFVGAFVMDSHLSGGPPGGYDVLDLVVSIHEVNPE